jgi:hypothetical protein
VGDEGIERSGVEDDLLAVGPSEPGSPADLGGGLSFGRRIGWKLKEWGLVGLRPVAI